MTQGIHQKLTHGSQREEEEEVSFETGANLTTARQLSAQGQQYPGSCAGEGVS